MSCKILELSNDIIYAPTVVALLDRLKEGVALLEVYVHSDDHVDEEEGIVVLKLTSAVLANRKYAVSGCNGSTQIKALAVALHELRDSRLLEEESEATAKLENAWVLLHIVLALDVDTSALEDEYNLTLAAITKLNGFYYCYLRHMVVSMLRLTLDKIAST